MLSRFFRLKPNKLVLLLTHCCNARCIMCNIWQEKKTGELSEQDYGRILNNPFFNKIEKVVFSGGEAFLRKDLKEVTNQIIERLPRLRQLTIATNGLDKNIILGHVNGIIKRLREDGIDLVIQISVDGVGEEHNQIRGVKDAHIRVLETINALKDIQKSFPNLYLAGVCAVQPINVSSVEKVYNFFKYKGMDDIFTVVTTSQSYYNNLNNESLTFTEDQLNELKEVLNESSKRTKNIGKKLLYYDLAMMLEGEKQKRGCPMLRETLVIESDGRVIPCIMAEDYPLGDIITASPQSIWSAENTIKQVSEIREKRCSTCMAACGVSMLEGIVFTIKRFLTPSRL